MYIYHFLFCSFSDKSAHTLKLQSMRGKERRKEDEFSTLQWLSWQHQPLPKEICPASVLIKHIYNSVLYICNLTIELVPFNWQQMVCDYCLPRRKRKKKACQYLLIWIKPRVTETPCVFINTVHSTWIWQLKCIEITLIPYSLCILAPQLQNEVVRQWIPLGDITYFCYFKLENKIVPV